MQSVSTKENQSGSERTSRETLDSNVAYQAANGFKETLEGYLSGNLSEKDVYEALKRALV